MSWITITEADLLTRLSGAELEQVRAAGLAAGQADPVAAIINDVVAEVRFHIQACARNSLSADASKIPQGLKGTALDIITLRTQQRAAGTTIDPKDARAQAVERAYKLLDKIAACEIAVEQPDSGAIGSPSPSFSGRERKFTQTDEEGI